MIVHCSCLFMIQTILFRGVVQLFNAVKQQQKSVEEKLQEAGPSVRRQDHVIESLTKGQFIDVLKKAAPETTTEPKKKKKKVMVLQSEMKNFMCSCWQTSMVEGIQ